MSFDGKRITNPHGEFIFQKVNGYADCACCGIANIDSNLCAACFTKCNPARTWHCFVEGTAQECDGSCDEKTHAPVS